MFSIFTLKHSTQYEGFIFYIFFFWFSHSRNQYNIIERFRIIEGLKNIKLLYLRGPRVTTAKYYVVPYCLTNVQNGKFHFDKNPFYSVFFKKN